MGIDYKSFIVGLGLIGVACNSISATKDDISIIPAPLNMVVKNDLFELPERCTIGISDKTLMPAANYLAGILSRSTGFKLTVKKERVTSIFLFPIMQMETDIIWFQPAMQLRFQETHMPV